MITDRTTPPGVPRWLATAAGVAWRVLLVAVTFFVAASMLARLRVVIVPVIIALFVAAVLSPPVQWLKQRGWPPLAAAWAVYLLAAAVFSGLALWIVPAVAAQVGDLQAELTDAWSQFKQWLTTGPLNLTQSDIDRLLERAGRELSARRGLIVTGAVSGAILLVEVIAGLILTIILTFFFVKDGDRMSQWILSQVDPAVADDLRAIGQRAWQTLSGYLRAVALDGLVEAGLKAIGLLLLGVPLVVPLSVLTFFGGFFPLIGAVAASVVAAAVALATKGPVTAALVIALGVFIQNVASQVIDPLVMARVVKLHPTVVLVAVTTGAIVAGIFGAFLAVPVVAVAVTVGDYWRHHRPLRLPDEPDAVALPSVEGRR